MEIERAARPGASDLARNFAGGRSGLLGDVLGAHGPGPRKPAVKCSFKSVMKPSTVSRWRNAGGSCFCLNAHQDGAYPPIPGVRIAGGDQPLRRHEVASRRPNFHSIFGGSRRRSGSDADSLTVSSVVECIWSRGRVPVRSAVAGLHNAQELVVPKVGARIVVRFAPPSLCGYSPAEPSCFSEQLQLPCSKPASPKPFGGCTRAVRREIHGPAPVLSQMAGGTPVPVDPFRPASAPEVHWKHERWFCVRSGAISSRQGALCGIVLRRPPREAVPPDVCSFGPTPMVFVRPANVARRSARPRHRSFVTRP